MPELTEQEFVKILIYEQDKEAFIQLWLKELIDWLNANPVSSFGSKYEDKKEV